jgi:hypothetical protein
MLLRRVQTTKRDTVLLKIPPIGRPKFGSTRQVHVYNAYIASAREVRNKETYRKLYQGHSLVAAIKFTQ